MQELPDKCDDYGDDQWPSEAWDEGEEWGKGDPGKALHYDDWAHAGEGYDGTPWDASAEGGYEDGLNSRAMCLPTLLLLDGACSVSSVVQDQLMHRDDDYDYDWAADGA